MGVVELHLKTPDDIQPIPVVLDVVNVDVPAFLGLDALDSSALYAVTVTNRLVNRVVTSKEGQPLTYFDAWSVPLVRYDNHVYAAITLPLNTFFTLHLLIKLHRQFAHTSTEKLYKLLKIAKPEETSPETLKTLQDMVKSANRVNG